MLPCVKSCLLVLIAALVATGCAKEQDAPLFERLSPEVTGIHFANTIVEQESFNVLAYEYFYNGGGVAVGDLNDDGLPDLYFTANMGPDHLYMNRGNWTFEEIGASAGLTSEPGWHTGVTMADVNADGLLDIYVLRSGNVSADRRRNLLYINNGDETFSESAADVGLDIPAYSNHAAFFDYDRDGDLDAYLLNHPIRRFSNFAVDIFRNQRDSLAGDQLLRNDSGQFINVSDQAGIKGNPIGFGLGVVVSDINSDGWSDLYVANDYIEDDYLYINNQDGTFSDQLASYLPHTPYSSMGVDIADVNHDGRPDIMTLDMMPEHNTRQKLLKGPESHAYYEDMRRNGYHEQYMRNMLQINRGAGLPFAEVGQLAGVAHTDWSWASLFADFDLDGYTDLLITNGYFRDYTNLDFLETSLTAAREATALGESFSSYEMIQQMPQTPIPNYIFQNRGDFQFENATERWGLSQPSFSNGAAYADLDLDGDLDLIINAIGEPAFIYRNAAKERSGNAHLHVKLNGNESNPDGFGAQVTLHHPDGRIFHQEVNPGRGYLSSVSPTPLFGLDDLQNINLEVTWPDGSVEQQNDVQVNQTITLHQSNAKQTNAPASSQASWFSEIDPIAVGLDFVHQENLFDDFDVQPLLIHRLSRFGPALATGDVNRDGLDDVYLGGAAGQTAGLYLQQLDGSFLWAEMPAFATHQEREDTDATFFDADGDGDLDLYVVSGGASHPAGHPAYQDRLYVNNGFGLFEDGSSRLPNLTTSGAVVAVQDIDGDDDLDLFVGSRHVPGRYPETPQSFLLINEGNQFVDRTTAWIPELQHAGMITDALWTDFDQDQSPELLLAGEWMPIRIFERNDEQGFDENTDALGLASLSGWWQSLSVVDWDNDGDLDFFAGNRGLNGYLKASPSRPASLHATDLDANGTLDLLPGHFLPEKAYPAYNLEILGPQIPALTRSFPTHTAFSTATVEDLLALSPGAQVRSNSASTFASTLFLRDEDGSFSPTSLPNAAQIGPIHSFLLADFNVDDLTDVFVAGNNSGVRSDWGWNRSSVGQVVLNELNGEFRTASPEETGLITPGDVRSTAIVQTVNGPMILVANNDAPIQLFMLNR